MNYLYNETYEEALNQNEINEEKWKNHKKNLNETRETINTFIKSCKLDIMVPIGKKAFVRGTLRHTNDLLISHGSSYFSLASNFQANNILKQRDEICVKRLKELDKEKELFRGKLEAPRTDAFGDEHEIIEDYDEAAEMEWRKKHRESVKKLKQEESNERSKIKTDDEIKDLLDRYELIEEYAEELENLSENEDCDYDDLLKIISGEMKVPETKIRISHNLTPSDMAPETAEQSEKNAEESKVEIKASPPVVSQEKSISVEENPENNENIKPANNNKRKVRFSTSLDVKIIEPKEEQAVYPAIQIKFHHSSEKFNPNELIADKDIKFRHPGEIVNILSEINVQPINTKSILKETNYKYEKMNHEPKSNLNDDDEIYESLSKFPLICGEVIERSAKDGNLKLTDDISSKKKVSKFKVLRSKAN